MRSLRRIVWYRFRKYIGQLLFDVEFFRITQLGTSFIQEVGFLEVVVEMNGSCCSIGDYPRHLAEEYNQALQTFTRTILVIANFFG